MNGNREPHLSRKCPFYPQRAAPIYLRDAVNIEVQSGIIFALQMIESKNTGEAWSAHCTRVLGGR